MQELDSLIDRIPKDQIQINDNNKMLYEPVEQVDLQGMFLLHSVRSLKFLFRTRSSTSLSFCPS